MEAFVHADGHVQGLFLCAVGIGLALPQAGGVALAGAALLGFAVSSPNLLTASPTLLRYHVVTSFGALTSPRSFHARFLKETAAAEDAVRLPRIAARVGAAAMDVFGNEPAVAVLNHFSYRPRPVFQSYEACSRPLAAINADYYAGRDAPHFVLFRPAMVDNRFFPSDDPYLLILLLQNYRCVAEENGWRLLEQPTASSAPSFQPIATVNGRFGQPISVPPHQRDSFVTVKIEV